LVVGGVIANRLLVILFPQETPPEIISVLLPIVIGFVLLIVLEYYLGHPRIAERPFPPREDVPVNNVDVDLQEAPSNELSSLSSQNPRPGDQRVHQDLNLLVDAAPNDNAAHVDNAVVLFTIASAISVVVAHFLGLSSSTCVCFLMILTFLLMLLAFLRQVYSTKVGRFEGNQDDNGGGGGGRDANDGENENEANSVQRNGDGGSGREGSQGDSSGGITF
jgi:hypothetical protein